MVKQLTKEYKCISENLFYYFVYVNSLLNNFESVNIQHVPRIENQVVNASGYKVFKQKLQELIKIKEKLVPIECPSTELSMAKLVGAEGESDFGEPYAYSNYSYPEIFEIFTIDKNRQMKMRPT